MTQPGAVLTICAVLAMGTGASAQVAGTTANSSPFSREFIRRAIAASSPVISPVQGAAGVNDWQRVRDIKPKSDIFLDTGSWSAKCTVLASDDRSLAVLKLNKTLPFAVTEMLRQLLSRDPQALLALTTTGSRTDASSKVTIAPDGIFVGDKKIAATSDVIMRIDRTQVREVRKRPAGRSVGRTIGGAFLGAGVGAAVGSLINKGCSACWGAAAGGTGFAILLGRDPGPIYVR